MLVVFCWFITDLRPGFSTTCTFLSDNPLLSDDCVRYLCSLQQLQAVDVSRTKISVSATTMYIKTLSSSLVWSLNIIVAIACLFSVHVVIFVVYDFVLGTWYRSAVFWLEA